MPLWARDKLCGDIDVVLTGEKLEQIEKNEFIAVLKKCTRLDGLIQSFDESESWMLPSDSPFALKYDPVDLRILIDIPLDQEKAQALFLNSGISERYSNYALKPAPFSGAINYRAEKTFSPKTFEGDSFNTYFDTFFNIKEVVIESQFNYLNGDNSGTGWFRGDTRAVKDFKKYEVRAQAGDVYPQSYGFMQGRGIGGLLVSTDFSLDPYSLPYPQGHGNFVLRSRSNVRTWVNGILVKDEVLPAGNYDLRDIPLINGVNNVVIETIDEFDNKKVYQFNLPTSVELLNKGKWKFSLASGVPFSDMAFKRKYHDNEGLLTSGFAQYGLSQTFTLGGYTQTQNDFNLFGIEAGKATALGNFFLGAASSGDQGVRGTAGQMSWQFQRIGAELFNSYTLILRHQIFGENFVTADNSVSGSLKSRSQVSITLPLKELFTLSLGGQYGDTRDERLNDRYGMDATFNIRLHRNLNLSTFVSRVRDEHRNWNDVAYAFLTWSFDGSGNIVNIFQDFENQSTRISALRDNSNKIYSPRITSNLEKSQERTTGEIEAFVPMPFAEVGARLAVRDQKIPDTTGAKSTVRFAQAFVFAYDDEWGAGLSRPVPNSFVLFKPSEVLRKQKLSLRSTSPYNEGSSGLFGEITYTNLLPYQYRDVQLDPTFLDEGTTLEQERFAVYPTYRSAHLIPLKDKGQTILDGYLINSRGEPLKLKVGEVAGQVFFTSPEGRFFIEGVEPGTHKLTLRDSNESIIIEVKKDDRGIVNLGRLTVTNKK